MHWIVLTNITKSIAGILYVKRLAIGCLWMGLFGLLIPLQAQQLALNEVMASNATTLADEDGDYTDWIELHNFGNEIVNLNGYGLSDDYTRPFRWVLPNVELSPGGYLLVFASGKDRALPGQPLHTNFSIKESGEALVLSRADGVTIDHLPPTQIPTDISYGRYPNGTGGWQYYFDASPGEENTDTGFPNLLEPPVFSHAGGWYTDEFMLELSHNHPDAVILFTLDGSRPCMDNLDGAGESYTVNYFFPDDWASSQNLSRKNTTYLYEDPITVHELSGQENDISEIITTYRDAPNYYQWNKPDGEVFKGTVVRAMAYDEGNRSPLSSHSYFVDVLGRERYTLPVVSIVADNDHIFGYHDGIYVPGQQYFGSGGSATNYHGNYGNYMERGVDWERPVHMEYFEVSSSHAVFAQSLGMRIHGGFSRVYPLKGLRLYARNQYDTESVMAFPFIDNAYSPLTHEAVDRYKRLVLHDYHQRDMTAIQLMQHLKMSTQGSSPLVHFINGEYWGITYAKARFDRYHIANTFGLEADNVVMLDAPYGTGSSHQVDEGFEEDILLYSEMYNFAIDHDLGMDDNYALLQTMLDIESFVDYYFAFIFVNNRDWYGAKHFKYWRARETDSRAFHDGKWRLLGWDFDMSLNHDWVHYNMLGNAIHPDGLGEPPYTFVKPERTALLVNLLENDQFKTYFINRFADLLNTTAAPAYAVEVAQNELDKIGQLKEEHVKRWHYPVVSVETTADIMAFLSERPNHLRAHLQDAFYLDDEAQITLDVSDPDHGIIQINSVKICPLCPGVDTNAFPWSGQYFRGQPISLKAIPNDGFLFSHWSGHSDATSAGISLVPEDDMYMKAHFIEAASEGRDVVHYWHFNNLNDGVLTHVHADYSATGLGEIQYPGSGTGYLDHRTHRETDPVSNLNLLMNQQPDQGAVLRARNPSDQRELIISTPTRGYENIVFTYAGTRTSSGAEYHSIYFATDETTNWTLLADDLLMDELPQWKLFNYDLRALDELNDNENLRFKVTFHGEQAGNDAGNNRFDNMSITGNEIPSNISESTKTDAFAFRLAPNPARERLRLIIDDAHFSGAQLKLLRMDGTIMLSMPVLQKTSYISLADMPAAVYMVQLISDNKNGIKRLIVTDK